MIDLKHNTEILQKDVTHSTSPVSFNVSHHTRPPVFEIEQSVVPLLCSIKHSTREKTYNFKSTPGKYWRLTSIWSESTILSIYDYTFFNL